LVFLTKKGPEGPGVTALYIVGGITTYKEDLNIKVNYKQVFQKCKRDPRSKDENDIRSFSTELGTKPRCTTIVSDARDVTTWVEDDVACRAEAARGPP
jgi:hypothetical protein